MGKKTLVIFRLKELGNFCRYNIIGVTDIIEKQVGGN